MPYLTGHDLVGIGWLRMDGKEGKTFDTAERSHIRQKLLRYMEANAIGVPRLAERITKAHPRRPEIPVKTLQRFLAGDIRTSDSYVNFFSYFAEDLPYPDALGDLARSLIATFNMAKKDEALVVASHRRFTVRSSSASIDSIVSLIPDDGFFRLRETVTSPRPFIYDGVMISTATATIAVLKEQLWGLPTCYLLHPGTDKMLGQRWNTDFEGMHWFCPVELKGEPNEA